MALIDSDVLIKEFKRNPTDGLYTEEIVAVVNEAPEVDPVHVAGGARCYECEYKRMGRSSFGVYYYCGHPSSGLINIGDVEKNFCSYGRRKENVE